MYGCTALLEYRYGTAGGHVHATVPVSYIVQAFAWEPHGHVLELTVAEGRSEPLSGVRQRAHRLRVPCNAGVICCTPVRAQDILEINIRRVAVDQVRSGQIPASC